MVSSTHNVCAKDVYIAIVSTIVETDRPEQEIQPGLALLGPIYDKYVWNQSLIEFLLTCSIVGLSLLRHYTRPLQVELRIIYSSRSHTMQHHTSKLSWKMSKTYGNESLVRIWFSRSERSRSSSRGIVFS